MPRKVRIRSATYSIALIVMVAMVALAGCNEARNAVIATPDPKSTVATEQSYIEKIIVYNQSQATVFTTSDKDFAALERAITKFQDFTYAPIKWAAGGNSEVVQSQQKERGVLVIFSKPVLLKPAEQEVRIRPCKRLYIPLSGGLVENDSIIIESPSEYSWDWGGIATGSRREFNHAIDNLESIVSKSLP